MENQTAQDPNIPTPTEQFETPPATQGEALRGSETHEPKKKFHIPKIVLLVLGLFLLLALMEGGYYLFKNSQSSDPNPEYTETKTSTPTSKSDNTDPTAGWETYVNEEFGFSLKYPSGWGPENCLTGSLLCSEKITEFSDQTENLYYFIFSNDEPLIDNLAGIGKINYTEDEINGIKVLKTTDLPSRSGAETVFFKKNDGKYIQLGFTPYNKEIPFPKQQQNYEIFNQILSTFKFTDANETSNVDTSAWKIYENEYFSIKYPPDFTVEKEQFVSSPEYESGQLFIFKNKYGAINIGLANNNLNLSSNDGLENVFGKGPIARYPKDISPYESIKIGFAYYGWILANVGYGPNDRFDDFIWFKDKLIYEATNESYENLAIAKQMLTTFQFTE